MVSVLNYFRSLFEWVCRSYKPNANLCEPLVHRQIIPEFEFRPSAALQTHFAKNTRFEIANAMDIMLQERGLMADSLVVEAFTPGYGRCMLWCRYNTNDLATRGIAECILFANDRNICVDHMCGVLCDRKRN